MELDRHLVLFDCGWFDGIDDRINYIITEKSAITDSINRNFPNFRVHSINSLPINK